MTLLTITVIACSKEEVLIHENLTVPGNKPKDYSGIPTVLVENYVTKMYIDLIGQKPTDQQFSDAVEKLENEQLSDQAREEVITSILSEDAYHDRLFQNTSDLLLNGMGYAEVLQLWTEYGYIRDLLLQTGDTLTSQFFDYEIEKLQFVLDVIEDYKSGSIDLSEYYSRMCYNAIYDEINMGSENFVKSCFENLFKRNPTESELSKGVLMVDGQPSSILLRDGTGKIDFIDIVTSDKEFYEGRIRDAYQSLLLRESNSAELSAATESFVQDNNFKKVQMDIMKTDEYAGFE